MVQQQYKSGKCFDNGSHYYLPQYDLFPDT